MLYKYLYKNNNIYIYKFLSIYNPIIESIDDFLLFAFLIF